MGKRKEYAKRINLALGLASDYGSIDGEHHKMWVIDQMVRALTGSAIGEEIMEKSRFQSADALLLPYERQRGSEEYKSFVAHHNDGEDGPDSYIWNTGIVP